MLHKAVIFCKSSSKTLFLFSHTTGFYDTHEVLSCVASCTQMHPLLTSMSHVNDLASCPSRPSPVDSLSLSSLRFFKISVYKSRKSHKGAPIVTQAVHYKISDTQPFIAGDGKGCVLEFSWNLRPDQNKDKNNKHVSWRYVKLGNVIKAIRAIRAIRG